MLFTLYINLFFNRDDDELPSLMTQIESNIFRQFMNHGNVSIVQRPPINTQQRSNGYQRSHGYFPWELETTDNQYTSNSLRETQHP